MSPIEFERVDGVQIAHVREDIDAANVTALHDQLAEALGPDTFGLIVDLSEVRYLDSAGLDMLLRLGDRLGYRRARLSLVIPADSQLNKLVAIVGLPEALDIHPSLAGALGRLREDRASPSPPRD